MKVLPMEKLVATWTEKPTLANAIRIRDYANLRPMSILMLDAEGIVRLGDAILSIKESK